MSCLYQVEVPGRINIAVYDVGDLVWSRNEGVAPFQLLQDFWSGPQDFKFYKLDVSRS